MTKQLIGYGGGGGKGGEGSERTPVESPNTLKSKAHARVLDLLCEGEIVGLVDGLKSVYLDGVAVQNPDNTFNFKDVVVYDVPGTQDQEYIPGFPSAEAEFAVDTELTYNNPIVRTVSNVNAIRITIEIPQLTFLDVTNGDLKPNQASIKVEAQKNGGGYVLCDLAGADVFKGKCVSPYQRAIRVELPGPAGTWDIKITRLTPNDANSNMSSKTYWKSYATIIDEKLTFPNSAVIGVQVNANQFDSIPTRSYRIKGLKVKVPTNYDPVTRVYTGVWDGTFKIAWTDNPAWCFYDILLNTRYGLGNYINAAGVDKWSLYTIAQYCDQLVPNGLGGTEPRFRCNLYIQSQEDAYSVIKSMASIFRGMDYWASGAVYVAQDAPRDPEYLFTPANVVDGAFSYSSSGKRARHTVAIVTWNDPTNHFKQAREFVADEAGLAINGYNPVEVAALGCTSRSQAIRVGRWLLYTERLETEVVTFKTGLEGALRNPGAIIKVQDPYRAGKRFGGRIQKVLNAFQLELDSEVDLQAGVVHTINVIMQDGSIQTRDLVLGSGPTRQVSVVSPFFPAPDATAIWVLTTPNLAPVLYRVITADETEPTTYEITALRHNPGKFDEVELGIKTTLPPTSIVPSTLPPTVTLSEGLYRAPDGAVKAKLIASWTQAKLSSSYIVRWREAGGNWNEVRDVPSHYWELLDAQVGAYEVRVASVYNGFTTDFGSDTHTLVGKTAPPSAVTAASIALQPMTETFLVSWTAVSDLDLDHYLVNFTASGLTYDAGSSSNRYTSISNSIELAYRNVPPLGDVHVAAVDTSGNVSAWVKLVGGYNIGPDIPSLVSMTISSTSPA